MAKKPTGADAEKVADLEKQFAAIKKMPHYFAMQLGKNGVVFMSHKRWAPEVLERKLRKAGGSAKGAKGVATMSGKLLELQCDDLTAAPTTMDKKAKMEWKELGLPIRVSLVPMTDEARAEMEGAETDGEEENTEATEGAEAPETATEEAGAGGGGGGDAAGEAEGSGGESADGSDGGGDGEEQAAAAPQEDLVTSLQTEYDELKPKIEASAESENKGFAKKVAGLNTMFEAQIDGNAKKARAVLGLLQTTLQAGIDAGDLNLVAMEEEEPTAATGGDGPGEEEEDLQMSTGEAGAEAPDPAVLEARRSRIADLERSVDDLLAQFAAG